jgi:ADP-sugar diphosphatase
MEALEDAPKFRFWRKQMEMNGLVINDVKTHFIRRRQNGEVLFAMIEVDADTPEGDKIPPVCFLKGHAAVVLVVLVRQRRICDGSQTYEHPAGMVDAADNPTEVAAREVGEEIGLSISPEELTKLNPQLWFPSTGTSDEAIHYFYVEKRLSRDEIMAFHNKNMGNDAEFERIVTFVATMQDAHRLVTNVNGLLIHFLYLKAIGDFEAMRLL